MTTLYQRISGADYRNIWAVGDLHGCHTLLNRRLDQAGFDITQDLLICVGDLIDRGSENVQCLELLQMPWFRAVRGNHEQMAIDGLGEGDVSHWIANGGGWYFYQDIDQEILSRALMELVKQLPHVIDVETSAGRHAVIAHADYPDDEYRFGKSVFNYDVVWNRERLSNSMDGEVRSITGADLFLFGHTPVSKPTCFANQMYIDTGAVFCGNLTLIQLQGRNDENCFGTPLGR